MNNNKNWIYVVIVLLILVATGGGYYYWKNNQKNGDNEENIKKQVQQEIGKIKSIIDKISPPEISDSQDIEFQDKTIAMKDYYNEDHDVRLKYPADWKKSDAGGAKNVTEPLMRENIIFFYLPDSRLDENDPQSSIVSIKLLRYVLEKSAEINSGDDWYDYVKEKVDGYVANPILSENYELKNLAKGDDIDGKWVIVEDYVEHDLITGKDYYIYNGEDFYQFVTKAPNTYFVNYLPLIQKTVSSFQIGD